MAARSWTPQRSCDGQAARTSRSSSISFIEEKQISPVFQS